MYLYRKLAVDFAYQLGSAAFQPLSGKIYSQFSIKVHYIPQAHAEEPTSKIKKKTRKLH
jgi:hypothetical protein